MKTIRRLAFSILLSLTIIIFMSGCSSLILGLAVGPGIDKNHKRNDTIEALEIKKISKGKKISINLRNDTVVKGVYKGRSLLSGDLYALKFQEFKNRYPDDPAIPSIGDTLDIYDSKTGSTIRGTFIYFDLNKLVMKKITTKGSFKVNVNYSFNLIYNKGKPFNIKKYPDFPLATLINLKTTEEAMQQFPIEDIWFIAVKYSYHYKYYGLAAGIMLDVMVAMILYNNVDWGMGGGIGGF